MSKFAFACAGTPEFSAQAGGSVVDPEGGVIFVLVPLAGIGVIDPDSDVIRVDFGSLNGRREELIADGVRLPRPEVSVNEDIEPRSILLNRGTFTATVGLPANNAVALIDYTSGTVEKIRGLEQADFSEESAQGSAVVTGRALWRSDRPEVSVSAGSAGPIVIAEHDVAAIHVVDSTADNVVLDVVMGRGPARASGSFNEGSQADYFSPDFQHSVARIRISEATGEWTVEGEVSLLRSGGVPITGLPNLLASSTGLAFHDEVPFDVDRLELWLDRLLAVAYRDAGTIGLFEISNEEAPILVASLPCATQGEPVDLVSFTELFGTGSETDFLVVLDRANGVLDVYREEL